MACQVLASLAVSRHYSKRRRLKWVCPLGCQNVRLLERPLLCTLWLVSARLSECLSTRTFTIVYFVGGVHPSTRTFTIVYFVVGVRPSVGMSVYQNAYHCVLCGWCPPVCGNVCLPERLPLCTLWMVSARLSECVYQNVHHCVHCGWCLLECLSTRTSTIVYFVGGVRPSV